ncbi:MAG: HAD family hydrolase [Thermoplasmataceae archaeon]
MTMKCILFDYGGTIAVSTKPFEYVLREGLLENYLLAKKIGYSIIHESFIRINREVFSEFETLEEKRDQDIPDREKYKEFVKRVFPMLPESGREEVSEKLCKSFWAVANRYFSPVQGLHETLEILHAKGFKLGIVSNHHSGYAIRTWLKQQDLLEKFDSIIISSEVDSRKPKSGIFLKALEMLDISPEETVFVGNEMIKDIQGARAVGMRTVLIMHAGSGVQDHWEASRVYPDHVVEKISDILVKLKLQ